MTPEPTAVDASVAAGYGVLSALDAETAALDALLMRCRAVMLLAASAELRHLERASADLDTASAALDAVSADREQAIAAASAIWGVTVSTGRELVERAPADFTTEISRRLDLQRLLLADASDAVEHATEVSRGVLETLARRRSELERLPSRPLTYSSTPSTPPSVVQQLA